MDDTKRKLIEQINRDNRLREKMLGPTGSLGEMLRKIDISQYALGGSMAAAIAKAGMLKGFDRPWEIHAERFRELSAFKPVEYSNIAKLLESSHSVFNDGCASNLWVIVAFPFFWSII